MIALSSYRGVRLVLTQSGKFFVPRLKRASIFGSLPEARDAIDQAFISGALR